MNIQSNFNQMLQTAGVVGGLYANYETGRSRIASEIRYIDKQIADTEKSRKVVNDEYQKKHNNPSYAKIKEDIELDATKRSVDLYKRKFELEPTPKNLKNYNEMQKVYNNMNSSVNSKRKSLDSLQQQTQSRQDITKDVAERKDIVKQIADLRTQGLISNKQAKSMTYKAQHGGEQNGQ